MYIVLTIKTKSLLTFFKIFKNVRGREIYVLWLGYRGRGNLLRLDGATEQRTPSPEKNT